jgi:hypothetical protein
MKIIHVVFPFMINLCDSELILTSFGLDFFSYKIKHRIKTINPKNYLY